MIVNPRRRRAALAASRAGTLVSALMVTVGSWAAVNAPIDAAGAAENAGSPVVSTPSTGEPLASGGSATPFALTLPDGAACSGDTASGGYRVQSYMVPASVDPATLTFGSGGPLPPGTGASFRQPLYDTGGTPFASGPTEAETGAIFSLPAFDLAVFGADGPQIVPAGSYNLGIACSVGAPSATQLDRFWNVQFTFVADPADEPSGISWTVAASQPAATAVVLAADPASTAEVGAEVTLTATVTPPAATGMVSFRDAGENIEDPVTVEGGTAELTTSSLVAGEHSLVAVFTPATADYLSSTSSELTFTVTASSGSTSTSSTPAPGQSSSTTSTTASALVAGGTSSGGVPSGTSLGQLPLTGASTIERAVWAVLLVVFGRMAVLLARPPRILPAARP